MARTKKDIDKDMMFQKIMPVLADNPFSNLPREGAQAQAPAQDSANGEISALRSRLSHTHPIVSAERPMPRNIMESMVDESIDSAIKKFNCCPCNRCREEIAACALNALPAAYVSGSAEEIAAAQQQVDRKNVFNALIKAVLQVRAHPKH